VKFFTLQVFAFEGFLKVYLEGHDDDEEERIFTGDESREKLHNNYITATERYSRPPARYTELLWLKTGRARIGRPSTYAPTISTININC
jgi:DNA topoisomerase-1